MKILKIVGFAVVGLLLVGVAGFFALGVASRDGSAPGLADGRLAPCPDTPNCVSSEEGSSGAQATEPLPASAWDGLAGTIAATGGSVIQQDEGYIAAEYTSAIFGFVDDVEFRKAEDAVHVRSASRVGQSDAGANAARVAAIRAALASQ